VADLSGYTFVIDLSVTEQTETADEPKSGQASRVVEASSILATKRTYPVIPAARVVVQT